MARTRFVPDTGLTVRMTAVMFLLGALLVAIVVSLMYVVGQPRARRSSSGWPASAVAFFQWWMSDTAGDAGHARPRGQSARRHPSCTA